MSINCLAYELYWNILSRHINPIATQQAALDNALVPPEKRLKIERCNAIIAFSKPQREETYQIKDIDAYNFKLEKKKFRVDTEVFREILQICPRILNQYFIAPPSEEELVTFIQELGYSGKCISRKTTGLDRLRESRAQILWGMYNKKNVEYVALLWEDFMYQADNREISSARKEHMPYPRFTKVIINHFISKDKTISMRNRINLHTICDDSLLDIKDSNAYKTYYDFATRKAPPRKARKYKKVASLLRKLSPVKETEPVKKAKRVKRPAKKSTTAPTADVVIRDTPGVSVSKKKAPAKADRSKGIEILSDVALSEAAQLKEATKRSKKDFHISQACGSGDGTDFESGVPDEQQCKTSGTDEETGTKPGVPDVPKYQSESDDESWGDSEDDNDDDSKGDDDKADSDDDDYDEEGHDEKYESDDDNDNVYEEEDDDLYKDVDVRSLGAKHEKKGKKTESSKQSSSVSSNFASKFLILENVPPAVDEVASMMNVKICQEESSTQAPSLFTVPETVPDFSSLFGFDQRVSTLETKLSQLKQADHSAQLLESIKSQLPTMKAQEERKLYIDVVEKSVKDIIKDEVKSLLPQILPKKVSDFATPVIQTTSLTEFELKKILLDKVEKSKSYQAAPEHRELYDGLVKSYNLDKDLFSSYGNVYSLKRDRDDKDKDEDPFAGSDRGLKKRKTSKDAEPPKGSKLKESNTSSSKGTKSQPKSSGKFVQTKEPVFETADTKMPQDQGGDNEDQPNVEETPMDDWFKKPNKPPTPDRAWNDGKSIDSRPPQKWISNIAKARQPPRTFDELMSTPIDFSAYVMHNLKIDNLTQEILVGPAFNLLKGTCKSFVELEYHFEECYKAVTDQLDWNNPEGHEYPFDLSKPLPLIEAQGRQVVPADYFFNNDLEYMKGVSSSRKYTTSTTKTKVDKYDNIEGIEDMVPTLWSPVKVAYDKFAMWGISHWGPKRQKFYGYTSNRESKHDVFSRKRIIAVTHVKLMKWYDYGYLEEIIVRREDQTLNKFKEGDFPRLNLHDIEDLLLLLVQKKLSNLEKDVIFDLNVALRISGIFKLTPYIAYKNPQGIIYQDKLKRNRLMCSDELYKFCDSTLSSVRRVLHDIANNLRMDYLPKRRRSNLDQKKVPHHDQGDRSAAV
ncbi:hypothetical protein Tco_0561092 [Tanacetum coccineum]